jgi:hypothetical protein
MNSCEARCVWRCNFCRGVWQTPERMTEPFFLGRSVVSLRELGCYVLKFVSLWEED